MTGVYVGDTLIEGCRGRAGYRSLCPRHLYVAIRLGCPCRGKTFCHGCQDRTSADADRFDTIPPCRARRVASCGLVFSGQPAGRPRCVFVLHVSGRLHRPGHDRCRTVGCQWHVAERPQLGIRQLGYRHGGTRGGLCPPARAVGRAGRSGLSASVRGAGAREQRCEAGGSGTACVGLRCGGAAVRRCRAHRIYPVLCRRVWTSGFPRRLL